MENHIPSALIVFPSSDTTFQLIANNNCYADTHGGCGFVDPEISFA